MDVVILRYVGSTNSTIFKQIFRIIKFPHICRVARVRVVNWRAVQTTAASRRRRTVGGRVLHVVADPQIADFAVNLWFYYWKFGKIASRVHFAIFVSHITQSVIWRILKEWRILICATMATSPNSPWCESPKAEKVL